MALKYFPRVVDSILDLYLKNFGAVYIKGPKWCGKTTTALTRSNSVLKMQDPDQARAYLEMADLMPSFLLRGETPRLIDEWQMAPNLWDAVRSAVDERNLPGQFILTGSTVVDETGMMHSGTGRIAQIEMSTFSLFESQESSGEVSLTSLFDDNRFSPCESSVDIETLAKIICRGGWPTSIKEGNYSQLPAIHYVDAICEQDASAIDKNAKNPDRVRAILRSYARKISTLASNQTILADVQANDISMERDTLYRYLSALKRLFVIDDIPAWNPSIRSATAMRASDKKNLRDPSIAAAVLGLNAESLVQDLEMFGFLFESLCVRDLKTYSLSSGGRVSYYRDRYGLECDIVLHLRDGRYALLEAKLGGRGVSQGVDHLNELKDRIKQNNLPEPNFCAVVTGGRYAYQTESGVYILPLACLKP